MKNNNKKPKKNQKKEELPSFLLGINKPDIFLQPLKKSFPVTYLGPLFFGDCVQLYPLPHSVNLRQEPVILHTKISEKNIFDDWFISRKPPEKKSFSSRPYKLCYNPKPVEENPLEHKCPGVLKVFKREIICQQLDLGETISTIYGETSREIPICKLKSPELIGSNDEDDFEIYTLSDLRERERMYMTPQEKAAHAHFPKEFATVRLVGPKIPESLIITSLPSRRKRISETSLNELSDQKTKMQKTEEEETKLSKDQEDQDVEMTVKPPNVRFTPSASADNLRMSIDFINADEGFEEMEGVEENLYNEAMEQGM